MQQARNRTTDVLAHVHWLTYTEDPKSVPGKYKDGKLAQIKRSQTFTKERRGETRVREEFSAVAESGEIHLSLRYEQGGTVVWATAEKPTNHLIYASTRLRSSQGRAFRESSQRVVRSGQLAYESFVTRQTVFQSSNVCDTVAGVLDLVFRFCGSCDVGRSVRSRIS